MSVNIPLREWIWHDMEHDSFSVIKSHLGSWCLLKYTAGNLNSGLYTAMDKILGKQLL
jgi:hypothetical protein